MATSNAHLRRRGMALLLVTLCVAVVFILGFAMLSASSLQGQVGKNADSFVATQYLAESGINLAIYYLSYPQNAGLTAGQPFWPGGTNISLGSAGGTVTVTVQKVSVSPSGTVYDITSTANPTSGAPQSLKARVCLSAPALSTGAALTLNNLITINGDLYASGGANFPLVFSGTVTGIVYSPTISNQPSLLSWLAPTPAATITSASPSRRFLTYSGGSPPTTATYVYNGITYTAGRLSADPVNTTLGPTVGNPLGVYWSNGNRKLNGNVTINGTLAVYNGDLTVDGANNVIQSTSDLPALMVDSHVVMNHANRTLTVRGVCWLGAGVTGVLAPSGNITVQGALVMSPGATIDSLAYLGNITATYDATKTQIRDLSIVQTCPSVNVVWWKS